MPCLTGLSRLSMNGNTSMGAIVSGEELPLSCPDEATAHDNVAITTCGHVDSPG
jgi:hypothetical protein